MRLLNLDPQWITPNVFVFKCPHCVVAGWTNRQHWLSVKNKVMTNEDQWHIFTEKLGDIVVVPSRPDFAWDIVGTDFDSISVTPSVDASPSGDWHGYITAGQIVGGI